jgi:hypothetical protein
MDPAVDPVAEFVAALREAGAALESARADLAGAAVHDEAFGRLFEAHDVRDAYHGRLPNVRRDLDEAREVLGHFVAGLDGGHPIVESPPVPAARPEP